jgi:hypothetical protein
MDAPCGTGLAPKIRRFASPLLRLRKCRNRLPKIETVEIGNLHVDYTELKQEQRKMRDFLGILEMKKKKLQVQMNLPCQRESV